MHPARPSMSPPRAARFVLCFADTVAGRRDDTMPQSAGSQSAGAERERLARGDAEGWRRWGPFLSDRAWGTVREDYSGDGDPWSYFSHDEARMRAYRWGDDGIGGF